MNWKKRKVSWKKIPLNDLNSCFFPIAVKQTAEQLENTAKEKHRKAWEGLLIKYLIHS